MKMRLISLCAVIFLCFGTIDTNPQLDGRIIGGKPASIQLVPYQVSLQSNDGHFCGGSVIHQKYIVTAAHCLENKNIKSLKIRAGSHFWDKGGIIRRICGATVHEKYEGEKSSYDYDIAVLQLCEDLIFGKTILPIALPKPNEFIRPETPSLVSGWGRTKNSSSSPRLMKVSLITHNQTHCRQSYSSKGEVSPRMLCAGCKRRVCDSCDGDSGGPLIANGKLLGIVSWGYGCADKHYPGVYSRVPNFVNWIKKKTKI